MDQFRESDGWHNAQLQLPESMLDFFQELPTQAWAARFVPIGGLQNLSGSSLMGSQFSLYRQSMPRLCA